MFRILNSSFYQVSHSAFSFRILTQFSISYSTFKFTFLIYNFIYEFKDSYSSFFQFHILNTRFKILSLQLKCLHVAHVVNSPQSLTLSVLCSCHFLCLFCILCYFRILSSDTHEHTCTGIYLHGVRRHVVKGEGIY